MTYLLLKWIHVMAAIAAVGANVTYGAWIARAKREPESLAFALRGVKFLDDRVVYPAYGLLLITGFAMAHFGNHPLSTPWLATSLLLFAAVVLIGLLGYTPTLRGQIRALAREGAEAPRFRALARRASALGGVLGVLVVAIVFLMVVKPALWG